MILTGGDPLMLSARRIATLRGDIESIDHVSLIRYHSRVPVADPGRISNKLVQAVRSNKGHLACVHVNHPRELVRGGDVPPVSKFIDAGIPVLSQSVLLKGVNDNLETLQRLMRALVAVRVKPYYLHHMDLAPGTAHFRTGVAEGQALVAELRRTVSGIAFPNYVLDIPGGYAKAQLALSEVATDRPIIGLSDGEGVWHAYREL